MTGVLTRVTWVDYYPKKDRGDPPIVRICGRSADGERVVRHVEGCRPHLYVPAGERQPESSEDWEILDVESGYQTHDGKDVLKVTVGHPKQVRKIKDADIYSYTAEADIPFYRRATWDYGLSGYVRLPDRTRCHIDDIETDIEPEDVDAIEPRVAIGDIEVLPGDDQTFEEMREEANQPVVAASLYDTFSGEYLLGVVDPDGAAEGPVIREHMEDHWSDHPDADEYLDIDLTFVRAESEVDLLNRLIGQVQRWRPDVISGWNWIDFDHEYLWKRMEKLDDVEEQKITDVGGVGGHKVETAFTGLPGFDEMEAYDDKIQISENRSLALQYVANEELGVGKIEAVDVGTAYERDRSRLAAYNLIDVQLCVGLSERHRMEEFYLELADLSAVQIFDCYYEKRLVDGYIASRRERDEVLPNQADRAIEKPAGGIVLTPSKGVEDNVAVFDLKSLYPSSMITCNISPETMTEFEDARQVTIPGMPEKEDDVGGSIEPSDINWDRDLDLPWSQTAKWFSFHKQGILAKYVQMLFRDRERYKALRDACDPDDPMYDVYDRRQAAYKVIMNSFYGVSNSRYFRLARDGIGDAITGVSRYVLWRAAEYVEDLGYEVIYGDTDSLLVRMASYEEDRALEDYLLDAKGLCNQLNGFMSTVADDLGVPDPHPYLEDADLHGTDQHCWVFEFEKFYGSFIQAGKKKRYAGKLRWKEGKTVDDVDITGFESQRADVPQITEEVQTDVIERVLDGEGFDEVSRYVRDRITAIREADLELHEIGLPMSIGKSLDDYGNIPRARAARYSNDHLGYEWGPGDTPWVYYVDRVPTGAVGTDLIAIEWNEEIPDGYEMNEERTVVKAFESALTPIVEEVGWTFSEVRSGKQNTAATDEDSMEYAGDPFGGSAEEPDDDDEDEDEWIGAEAW